MKVIGIVGSPRKNGNVETLVQEVLSSVAEKGGQVEKYNLNQMDYKGCQACMYCKTHHRCQLNDDMSRLMESMRTADAVVFGSPIYYWQFTSQFRAFIDRMYVFLNPDFTVTLPKGKKAVVITSQGNPDPRLFDTVFKDFDKLLTTYGFVKVGAVNMAAGGSPNAVLERKDLLKEARSLGQSL
ncbi:MAG: flavodoxin family protein [Methanomassiliicoccus sp.]|nr:flavodoxin family protein [Methanomassiliicoccus sp.]